MELIPASLQTTYANLLQTHLNLPAFAFEGAPFKMERKGKAYWYANQRGPGSGSPKQKYLGPDTEEMRARIETMRAHMNGHETVRASCTRMVAQLRAGGIPTIDQKTGTVLRAMSRSGVFRLGGTLVGTQAFRHYDLELGAVLSGSDPSDQQLRETEDLDIASFERLSMSVGDEVDPDLAKALGALGYSPANSLDMKKPTRWKHDRSIYTIDFLTPSFDDRQGPRHLAALNLWAQGLHYLDYLIKDPMPAVSIYMEGILIQAPRPERYAVHKLIVSQQRHAGSGAKKTKDIQQARAIIWAMSESRQYEIFTAIEEADASGPNWRKALDRALAVNFRASPPLYDPDRDVIVLEGQALGERARFVISGEALDDHFGAEDISKEGRKNAALANRAAIEACLSAKFRKAPSPETLLTTDEVPSLRKQ